MEILKLSDILSARYAAVVENSDDAIITKTLDGVITSWNPGARQIFGYTAEEMIGKPVTVLIPDNHLDEEPAILERLRNGERIEHYETVRRRKNGELINVSLSVSPLKNSAGQIVGASKIARDITRQKRTEQALLEMDQRKDEFIATLAHELRNPLAPIRQAAMLSSSPGATESQKRWSHEVINRQVQHMSLLLDDLLDISRITRGTLSLRIAPTALKDIVDAAVETARPTLDGKNHALTLDLPTESVDFAADPMRLSQVLSNLLTNAAKYTDAGGKIRLSARTNPENIEIIVTDSGIGISREALPGIFTMFSQVKSDQDRSEGGLGIGLALAKGIVALHGGTLTAQSAGPGRGSEFTLRIPRRMLSRDAALPSVAQMRPATVHRRVLIADDNRDAGESLALLLRGEGHDVSVVHDGHQAAASIEASPPDVALLDIGMPRLDGYEVARIVRRKCGAGAPILIAVTGWGQENDKARALAAGFDLHFTKPVEPERLIEMLGAETLGT